MVPPLPAIVVLPKFVAMLNPEGTDRFESVRLAVPLLVTVKVFVTGVPTVVVPKLKLVLSLIFPTPVSVTTISGALVTGAVPPNSKAPASAVFGRL